MKKLTKKSLDELASTMSLMTKCEKESYWGMYNNDCFWRCIAYLNSNGSNYSEESAASLAVSYFSSSYGNYTEAYLQSLGSGMGIGDLQNYVSSNSTAYSSRYVGSFDTSNISFYEGGGSHAVVILSTNSDGSLNAFDAQLNSSFTISAEQASSVQYLIGY